MHRWLQRTSIGFATGWLVGTLLSDWSGLDVNVTIGILPPVIVLIATMVSILLRGRIHD